MVFDLLWVPDALRSAGLTVVEYPGWQDRTHGRFIPGLEAVVWHHDASPLGDSPGVPAYMIGAWDTAAAALWVDRYGRWHIIGSGIAWHAGRVLPGMPSNSNSVGIETDHTTGEDWPPALLTSLRKGTAVILKRIGRDSSSLHFHKTICSPVGRKTDPDGLSLSTERAAVAALLTPGTSPAVRPPTTPTPVEVDMGALPLLKITEPPMDDATLPGNPIKAVVQGNLMARGYLPLERSSCDGLYGPQTAAAVTAFQAKHGLTADGMVGGDTYAELIVHG